MNETCESLSQPDGHRLAYRRLEGEGSAIVWLGGFASDMGGTKAEALAGWAAARGRAFVRFDYFGHGRSSGAFIDGTIGRWRQDALEVLDRLTHGPAVLVGSSMGGWIACLLALARPERAGALVLIAPAADFTDKLVEPSLSPEARAQIEANGVWVRPSAHEPAGLPFSARLLDEGQQWSILPGPVPIAAPVRVLQGGRDDDVPWTHALELFQALESRDAVFSLIRDGDHRLSRPQDLTRILAAVEEAAGLADSNR